MCVSAEVSSSPGSAAASVTASSQTCSQVCACCGTGIWGLFIDIKLHTAMKITVVETAVHKVHVGPLLFSR